MVKRVQPRTGFSGWRYEYDFLSYSEFKSGDTDIHKTVFTCAEDGICRESPKNPAIEFLTVYLNERGEEGWELVQMFPQQRGILCLFKKTG